MSTRRILLTQIIPALIAMIVAIPLAIWAFDNTPPVLYYQIETPNKVVRPGENFELVISGVRAYRCDNTRILQSITDSTGVTFEIPARSTAIPQDKIGQLISGVARVTVPSAIAPGPAVYHAKVEYRCNPWQRYVMPLVHNEPDKEFMISPREE